MACVAKINLLPAVSLKCLFSHCCFVFLPPMEHLCFLPFSTVSILHNLLLLSSLLMPSLFRLLSTMADAFEAGLVCISQDYLLPQAGFRKLSKGFVGVLSENGRSVSTIQQSISLEFHNNIHLFFSLLMRKDCGVTVVPISTSC